MKKIVVTLLLFMSFIGYSQTNGITYQAVILNPSGEQLPGVNNSNTPLAIKNICLKFSIIDHNSQSEYIETIQTTTDEFGMVNLVIGTGVQIGGYASSFSNILWNANSKNLKVDLSTTGICSYYTEISNEPFTAVPFALFALNTESTAVLTALQATVSANAIAATNAIAVVQSDVNQNELDGDAADAVLQNNITTVQNTVTSNASATTAALGLKEDSINKSTTTSLGTSDVLFPTQNAVKMYVDTNITTINASNEALQATVSANAIAATNAIAVVQSDVNQNELDGDAADAVLQNNITTVQNTVTSNASATTAALGLKEDSINKSTTTSLGTSDVLFPTQNAVKTYVDNQVTNGIVTNVSGIVDIANGGTGSSVQNFVDLTTNQAIGGNKSFNSDIIVSGLKVGNGGGSQSTVIGDTANATQPNNTAIGFMTLDGNIGANNTAIGTNSMRNSGDTSMNTSIGVNSGTGVNSGNGNTYLGHNANVITNSAISNATAVGAGAVVTESNTIQLGNASVTNVNTKGSITANAEISSEITANLTINNANAEQYKAKVLICNPTSPITITFGNDLPLGFNCMVLQKSADANKINLAGGSDVTLKNRNNFTATAGNYAMATIVNIGGGIIVTAGDMQ